MDLKEQSSGMSGHKSIKPLETGAGSALLIFHPRLDLPMKIHLERKSIMGGSRIPELPGHKSRDAARGGQSSSGGWALHPFSLDSGRVLLLLVVLLLLFYRGFVFLCAAPTRSWEFLGIAPWMGQVLLPGEIQAGFPRLFIAINDVSCAPENLFGKIN